MTAFALKKLIGGWLMPLPLSLLLLTGSCICLWLHRERIGRWLAAAALTLLVLCSCTAVPDLLLLPLEERYPKWDGQPDAVEMVVVMGAAQADAPRLPLTNRPNSAAIYRLLEGIAIYRANPGSKLVLSGGGPAQSHAVLMAQVATRIGVPDDAIVLQTESRDTEAEVRLLAPIVAGRRFALVTSAAHMPRAMAVFGAAGLQPLPAPTHYLTRDNPHPHWRDLFFPNVQGLAHAEFAAHEYLGLLWLKLTGGVE